MEVKKEPRVLDLVFLKFWEVGEVKVDASLDGSDHETVRFKFFG